MSLLVTLLTFLVVLSVLVFVHELGHFATAKMAGIKVQEFGFGYPPRLFGITRGETTYSVNLLPLGGFVKMLGENDSPGDPRAFASKSRTVRATVLVAGSAMNLLLVPLLYAAVFMIGEPVPCTDCNRVQVYGVIAGMPADRAGMREGDIIVSIEGQPVTTAEDVRRLVRATLEREITVVVERDGRTESLRLTPRAIQQENQGAIGIQLGPQVVTVQRPIWEAVPMGFQRTGEMLGLFLNGIRQMVVREVDAELTGPVGIARETGRAAAAGITTLLQFTAFLSLNLAVINMLPIPGLDGARLVFVLLEGARRGRRINPQLEGAIHLAGMVLLLTLMLYVTLNDVRRLVPV
jgi:regulator of sigma E protease